MTTQRLDQFKGINNRASANKVDAGYLRVCKNLNVDTNGLLHQRPGYTQQLSDNFHSLWSDGNRAFAVRDGSLVEIYQPFGNFFLTTTILEGIGDYPVSFTECDGRYFFTCAIVTGEILPDKSFRSSGIAKPASYPTLTAATNGTLGKGRYTVSVTYLDVNGVESGVKGYTVLELIAVANLVEGIQVDNQSIIVANIPVSTNPRVVAKAVYVSYANGTELYRDTLISNITTSHEITAVNDNTLPLTTKALSPAPFGTDLRYFFGRLFITSGKEVYYSQGYAYEHWDLREYLAYSANVTAVLPVEDGIWVSADALYFIAGRNPAEFVQVRKSNLRISAGSAVFIESQNVNLEGYSGAAWAVTCSDGVLMLGNSGYLHHASSPVYKFPDFTSVKGAIVETDDSVQYLALLQN